QSEVPPLGHVSVRPANSSSPNDLVEATRSRLTNQLVEVVIGDDGTLRVTGVDGSVLSGVGRLVDEGDRGDSYNFGPMTGSRPIDRPEAVYTEVYEDGPLRAVVAVERRYNLPLAIDPDNRDQRVEKTEE